MRQESTLSKTTHNIINEEEEWFEFWETPDDFVHNKSTTNRIEEKTTKQSKHIEGQVKEREREVSTNRDRYALPCLEAAERQCESLLDQSKIDRRLSSARMSATSVN